MQQLNGFSLVWDELDYVFGYKSDNLLQVARLHTGLSRIQPCKDVILGAAL